MTTPTYKADEATRRRRLEALEDAKWHVSRGLTDRDAKMSAAEDLLGYGLFTASQIAEWLGMQPWALEGRGSVQGWGMGGLIADQLPTAILLAKEGLAGTKPKTLIYDAYKEGFSFDMIGGLLCIHKNVVRRIVRRIEGEPWS